MDIETAIQEYLVTLTRLTPRTRKGYEQRLSVFSAWIIIQPKKIELGGINRSVVDQFVEHLRHNHHSAYHARKSVSTYTLAGYVRCIRVFLSWCLDDDIYSQYVKSDVIRKIKLPKTEKFVIETFTDQHLIQLQKSAKHEHGEHLQLRCQCVLDLLLCTGIRADELCTLRIQDVHLDPKKGYIRVHGKGNKWRAVPLIDFSRGYEQGQQPPINHAARRLLLLYKERYRSNAKPTDTFFVSKEFKALTVSGLERMFRRLSESAEIVGVRVSPHTFRHSFAARFAAAFGDVYLLSKILGHEDIKTTQEYLKTLSGTDILYAVMRRMSS